jgi:signal transduction histidine kinase
MARLGTSIASRIVTAVLAVHAVLLPLLFFGLFFVVERSHADMFVEHARTFARVLTDEFELGAGMDSNERKLALLDSAILSGEGIYAELHDNGQSTRSSLGPPEVTYDQRPTLEFGKSASGIYFVTLPIDRPGHSGELRLGFDERPTRDRIAAAHKQTLWVLFIFFLVTVALAMIMSRRLASPLRELQANSRRIASGDYGRHLDALSGISELRQLGTDLERMRSELVGVNEKLVAKIKERDESEARRMALEERLRRRQRLETVGTLAGGVAHEFNNALVPIILFTETALHEIPADSRAREDLDSVIRAARRARDIVQKVLTFSRQLGTEERRALHLDAAIEEALRLFRALVPANIEVASDIDASCEPVLADSNLVVQLVMNLCTNAYQAMRPAGGRMAVGLRTLSVAVGGALRAPPGEYTELYVSDTGHGMDAATIERIFEPFFTTREVGEGSGLGLAVVHGIAEGFGATVLVESEKDSGTTFRVLFPVLEPAETQVGQSIGGVLHA